MGRVYFRSVLLLYETRHKIDDAFRDNINGRLKHQLYRKLGSLNTRHEIYFQRENKEIEREIHRHRETKYDINDSRWRNNKIE